jgi:hypothetical protein
MSDEQDVADVQFIGEALVRFIEMSPHEVMQHFSERREDIGASVPGLKGGELFVGREAYNRFNDIASRALRGMGDDRVSFSTPVIASALRSAFSEIFLAERAEIDAASVGAMINRAFDKARGRHEAITHHLPCLITLEREPAAFDLGPIRFETSEAFLQRIATALERYRLSGSDLARTTQGVPIADVTDKRTKEYYTSFPWVGTVAIPKCERGISKKRAERAIDAALDVLRLFFPDPFAVRLRRGGTDAMVTRLYEVTSNNAGEIEITNVFTSDDAPEWLSQILLRYHEFLDGVGIWLRDHVSGQTIGDLRQRWLDSLHWYGQSIADQSPAGRVIKLAAVFERLTLAKERRGSVGATVANRVALLGQGYQAKDFRQIKKDVELVYACRSQLIHGALSPFDALVHEHSVIATAVARWILFVAFSFYRSLEEESRASNADLEGAFEAWIRNRKTPPAN